VGEVEMEQELKPCPFCGGVEIHIIERKVPADISDEVKKYELRCVKCTANFTGFVMVDGAEAVALKWLGRKWNTRA
jgi:transcriptional regulator NrdR family protein